MSPTSAPPRRFPILFTGPNRLMALLGLRPAESAVTVGPDRFEVRMGRGFRLEAARSAVRSVVHETRRYRSRGVHGWRGRWLVNASGERLVRIELDAPVPARMGPIPLKVHTVVVSVVDPDALIEALTPTR